MIEHLKNIVVGFWGIGIILIIASIVAGVVLGLAKLIGVFPFVMYPLMILIVAWTIGKALRG